MSGRCPAAPGRPSRCASEDKASGPDAARQEQTQAGAEGPFLAKLGLGLGAAALGASAIGWGTLSSPDLVFGPAEGFVFVGAVSGPGHPLGSQPSSIKPSHKPPAAVMGMLKLSSMRRL